VLKAFDESFTKLISAGILQADTGYLVDDLQYTRYADDITISWGRSRRTVSSVEGEEAKARYLDHIAKIDKGTCASLLKVLNRDIGKYGFILNRAKTRMKRKGGKIDVTGVTISNKTTLGRSHAMRIRAQIHHMAVGATNPTNEDLMKLKGHIAYLKMVNPPLGEKYAFKLDRYIRLSNRKKPVPPLS